MRSWGLLAAGIALIIIALIGLAVIGMTSWGGPGMGRRYPGGRAEYRSNGERIYFTATSSYGGPITYTGGPHWFRMHGGSCVTCHGPTGRGGIGLPMTGEVAPDIRFHALTSEGHEMGEEEHPPYNEELIKRAITRGLEPDGYELSKTMPRWRMTERDLDDLVDYLKTLDR